MRCTDGSNPAVDLVGQLTFRVSWRAVRRHASIKAANGEARHACRQIAEYVGEIFGHIAGEAPKIKIDVGAFRCVCDQPPSPQIRRQGVKRGVGENAAALTRRELAASISQPMKALDDVDGLPGFTASNQRCGEADRVEWHIVLAEKLNVLHVLSIPPPALPISLRWVQIRPLLRSCQIADWCVEPHVEDFMLEAGPGHRYTPTEIPRYAAIAQVHGQPAPGQRGDPRWPAFAAIHPIPQAIHEQRLAQEQMSTVTDFEVSVARKS